MFLIKPSHGAAFISPPRLAINQRSSLQKIRETAVKKRRQNAVPHGENAKPGACVGDNGIGVHDRCYEKKPYDQGENGFGKDSGKINLPPIDYAAKYSIAWQYDQQGVNEIGRLGHRQANREPQNMRQHSGRQYKGADLQECPAMEGQQASSDFLGSGHGFRGHLLRAQYSLSAPAIKTVWNLGEKRFAARSAKPKALTIHNVSKIPSLRSRAVRGFSFAIRSLFISGRDL